MQHQSFQIRLRLFLAVPQGCLRFVIVVFPDHTHLLFFMANIYEIVPLLLLKSKVK